MKTLTQFTQLLNNKFTKKNVIAPVESSSTASQAYTVGKKFFYNNILYKATADIAKDGLIVPDTNCTPADNIIDDVDELSSQVDDISDEIADMNNVLGAKNILPNDGLSTTTDLGITYTKQSDGSVIANGTATGWSYYNLCSRFTLDAGTYILSGKSSLSGTQIKLVNANTSADITIIETLEKREFTLSTKTNVHAMLYVGTAAGTVTNFVFKPMIRLASITDDTYVPYSMTNREMTPYVQAISNPNLLDNPWFTVNQRGQSSYVIATGTNAITVDRWHKFGGTVNVVDGGVELSTSDSSADGNFYSEYSLSEMEYNYLLGKTVTLSIKIGDNVYSKSAIMPSSLTSRWTTVIIITCPNNVKAMLVLAPSSTNRLQIAIHVPKDGNTYTIRAVKLELGSVSTLTMDTAPNYATELLKCQRYFNRFWYSEVGWAHCVGTNSWAVIAHLPCVMRAAPTISLNGTIGISVTSNDIRSGTPTIENYNEGGEPINIGFSLNGITGTAGEVGRVFIGNSYLNFSADL